MKVLFIGGTGNISADCAALLHQRGHQIGVVSRGRSSVPAEYQTIVADRKNGVEMRRALEVAAFKPDAVINFLGFELPDVQLDFELFRDSHYFFISSTTVYSKPPASMPITEDAPRGNPWWDYAQKKLACEDWLHERSRKDGFRVTIVRPSHTYSMRWVPNPVSSSSFSFAARIQKGLPVFVHDQGEGAWTLTAASDFAIGLGGLVERPETSGATVHITSDEVLTWNQIYFDIASALGVDSPHIVKIPTEFICQVAPSLIGTLKGDKAHPGVFDNSRIKRLVPDFVCKKTFRAGARDSVAWLRAHPQHQNLNPALDELIDKVLAEWTAQSK